MTTAYTWAPAPAHEYPDHPERPARLAELEGRLASFHAQRLEAAPATRDEIARVHAPRMIEAVEAACRAGGGMIDYAPTFVTPTSFDDALLASGGTLGGARAVWAGEAANAFALVRPPGHHAEPARAMGFCLFNNIAIAARDLLARGAGRVLVVDFDAHHGNGTQAAFWNEERLAYLSTHQWGIYPGTGRMDDAPHARGRLVNVPLVPYGKVGLDYFYWHTTSDGEATSFSGPSGGSSGSGGTLGAHASLGLGLNLDWISTDGEQDKVFIDSAFFAELTKTWADGFGNNRKFDMSAEQVMFGLSFDFE